MAHKSKLSLILIITSIVISSLFGSYDYFKEKTKLIHDFEETIAPVPSRTADYLARSLWIVNTNQANQIIEAEMKMENIYAAVVWGHDKKIFSARGRDKNWNIIESEGNISGEFVVKIADIKYQENVIGKLELYFTTRYINASLRRSIIEILIKSLIWGLAIAGIHIHIVNMFWRAFERVIEFPPGYHQAGIAILDYFGTVFRKKHPDIKATVYIIQKDMKLSMVIDPVEGGDDGGEIIEKALDEDCC